MNPTRQIFYLFKDYPHREQAVTLIKNNQKQDTKSPILFIGGPGTSKSALIETVVHAKNCSNKQGDEPCRSCPNCLKPIDQLCQYIDTKVMYGTDQMRRLLSSLDNDHMYGTCIVIDELQRVSSMGQEFLKEFHLSHPEYEMYAATDNPGKIHPAIMSRFMQINLPPVTHQDMIVLISNMAKASGLFYEKGVFRPNEAAIHYIASISAGDLRTAQYNITQIALDENKNPSYEEAIERTFGTDDALVLKLLLYVIAPSTFADGAISELISRLEKIYLDSICQNVYRVILNTLELKSGSTCDYGRNLNPLYRKLAEQGTEHDFRLIFRTFNTVPYNITREHLLLQLMDLKVSIAQQKKKG
jgi:DNA polymerase III gamma/tau subunit